MRSRCPNYKISISPNNFSSRILAYKHNENVANTALVRLYSIFEAIIIKYFFLLNFIQSLNLVLRNNFDLWTVIVVAFAQMSSLFIRYRTIVSGQEKKNLVHIPIHIIVHRIFRVLASIFPPPLLWYRATVSFPLAEIQ